MGTKTCMFSDFGNNYRYLGCKWEIGIQSCMAFTIM